MKVINVSKNYEPIEIPFGDGTVFRMTADLRAETINKCIEVIRASEGKANMLMAASDDEANEGSAAIMRELMVQLVGVESYDGLVAAIGGEGAKPSDVNHAMTLIWIEMVELVRDRYASYANSKAAHYLGEYYKAANAVAD